MDIVMIDSVGDMLNLAISLYGLPPKAVALEMECSISHMYRALKDIKSVPIKVRQKLSKINVVAASAVAMEATGFKRIFGFQQVDRHVQSMILRMRQKNKEASERMEALPGLLLDKNCREDLSPEEHAFVYETALVLSDQINYTLNLVMELETKYRLGLAGELQKEKRPLGAATPNGPLENQQSKYIMKKQFSPRIILDK